MAAGLLVGAHTQTQVLTLLGKQITPHTAHHHACPGHMVPHLLQVLLAQRLALGELRVVVGRQAGVTRRVPAGDELRVTRALRDMAKSKAKLRSRQPPV